jgi:carbonic anhydrase
VVVRNVGGRVSPDVLTDLAYIGCGDDAALAAEAVVDPAQTVRTDVELLLSSAVLPSSITVSGHVYDVTTGLVTTIIPATPVRAGVPGE